MIGRLYLRGANIDEVEEADKLGINRNSPCHLLVMKNELMKCTASLVIKYLNMELKKSKFKTATQDIYYPISVAVLYII